MVRPLIRSPSRTIDAVVVAVAAVATHATAAAGGNIWLDHAHFEQGLALAPAGDWPALFTRGFAGTGFYRPLAALSFSIDAALWHHPVCFHLVTLAWHAAAALLLRIAALSLGLSRGAALVAAVLFAVHPVTSLVASATAFRSEAMAAVCVFGLVAAHLARRPAWAALAVGASALTKETAWLLAPLIVAALELVRPRLSRAPRAAALRKLLLAEFASFCAATWLRVAFAPSFRARHLPLTLDEAIGTRLAAAGKSALALLVPLDRTICDAFPITSLGSGAALLGALALLAVVALALRGGRVGVLFGLCCLPSLQLVPVMRWWSPHYLYLPLGFAAMLAARAVEPRLERPWRFAPILFAFLGGLSLKEGLRYANDARLWTPEVAREPACREGHFYLGEVARNTGNFQVAGAHYERAAAPIPGYLSYSDEFAALSNLGAVRFAEKRFAEAEDAWRAALSRASDGPEQRRIMHNLGVLAMALHKLGREPEALAVLERLGVRTEMQRSLQHAR